MSRGGNNQGLLFGEHRRKKPPLSWKGVVENGDLWKSLPSFPYRHIQTEFETIDNKWNQNRTIHGVDHFKIIKEYEIPRAFDDQRDPIKLFLGVFKNNFYGYGSYNLYGKLDLKIIECNGTEGEWSLLKATSHLARNIQAWDQWNRTPTCFKGKSIKQVEETISTEIKELVLNVS